MAWIDYLKGYDMEHDMTFMDFGMCKNGWSWQEYNHLDREQYSKFEDSVDTKPGGTSRDSRHQKRKLLYRHYCLRLL